MDKQPFQDLITSYIQGSNTASGERKGGFVGTPKQIWTALNFVSSHIPKLDKSVLLFDPLPDLKAVFPEGERVDDLEFTKALGSLAPCSKFGYDSNKKLTKLYLDSRPAGWAADVWMNYVIESTHVALEMVGSGLKEGVTAEHIVKDLSMKHSHQLFLILYMVVGLYAIKPDYSEDILKFDEMTRSLSRGDCSYLLKFVNTLYDPFSVSNYVREPSESLPFLQDINTVFPEDPTLGTFKDALKSLISSSAVSGSMIDTIFAKEWVEDKEKVIEAVQYVLKELDPKLKKSISPRLLVEKSADLDSDLFSTLYTLLELHKLNPEHSKHIFKLGDNPDLVHRTVRLIREIHEPEMLVEKRKDYPTFFSIVQETVGDNIKHFGKLKKSLGKREVENFSKKQKEWHEESLEASEKLAKTPFPSLDKQCGTKEDEIIKEAYRRDMEQYVKGIPSEDGTGFKYVIPRGGNSYSVDINRYAEDIGIPPEARPDNREVWVPRQVVAPAPASGSGPSHSHRVESQHAHKPSRFQRCFNRVFHTSTSKKENWAERVASEDSSAGVVMGRASL